jgi:DNA-binding PadR family transcriptional regulator
MQFMPSVVKRRKPLGLAHSRNGLREAILGLLAIRPMTGYDLSRSYRRALQQIWYAPLGQVYPTLRKMRRDGLLRVSVKVQRHRPNRKVYSLTADGRKLLVLWLSQPAALPRMHHEFIHKLFQLGHVEAGDRGKLVEAYIKRCQEWALDLRRAEAMLKLALTGTNAENARFQLLSLRHLCRIVECEADSARQIAEEIRASPGTKARRPTGVAAENTAFAGQSLSPVD